MKKMIFPVITDREDRLPYYLTGVGIQYEQEDVRRPDGYPEYQYIQCINGRGELIIGKNRRIISEGCGMLLFPHEPHFYNTLGGKWEVEWVIFRGSGIEDFILHSAGFGGSAVLNPPSAHSLSSIMHGLYSSAASPEPTAVLRSSSLVYRLLTELAAAAISPSSPEGERFSRLRPVFEYINSRLTEPITLSALAEAAGVTPQHLCTVFKKSTSRTIFEYITMQRISRSKELLLSDSRMQIKEAAYLSGFCDESYFCAMFRRYEKMSPSEFRALHSSS